MPLSNAVLKALKDKDKRKKRHFTPLSSYEKVENAAFQREGIDLLRAGKAGCLVVAGGQGTRLGFHGPKGCFEILPDVTPFSILAGKVLNASKAAGKELPLAIMTSTANHEATVSYFQKHAFFGLQPAQIDFFIQSELPVLDLKGEPLFDANGEPIYAPAGNGVSLDQFVASGITAKWEKQGIEQVVFIQVDNILADPFDVKLLGYQTHFGQVVTMKAILRADPLEKVGVIVEEDGHVAVVEYSEIEAAEREAQTPTGELLHACANLSLFCFRMDFIRMLKERNALDSMPLHIAKKRIPQKEGKEGYKFEYFIFDVLPFATDVKVLVYPRSECFAPLKEMRDVESIQKLL